ncbi:unnamed protein product [Prorocentrum cordatum]|uniref:Phospholipase B-like n=1 Tax=Prorocentrum cordatum TaxID=2364126 RepID=A0ABN9UH83_9DINO|nr:unnamed protein product [Polarella glacialis]
MAGVPSGMSTLGRMGPHPRVQVSSEMDVRFGIDHKPCARMGLPYLPGGAERSTLEPDRVLTCPGGWLDRHTKRHEAAGREYAQRQQDTLKMTTMRAGGVVAERGAAMIDRSASASSLPAGGTTQGVRQLRTSASTADSGFWEELAGFSEAIGSSDSV